MEGDGKKREASSLHTTADRVNTFGDSACERRQNLKISPASLHKKLAAYENRRSLPRWRGHTCPT